MDSIDFDTRYNAHGLWVAAELLGASFDVSRPGLRTRIRLPKDAEDFAAREPAPEVLPTDACYPAPHFTDPSDPRRMWALNLFVVSATVRIGTLSEKHSREFFAELQDTWDRVSPRIEGVAHDFLKWARVVSRQNWLGVVSDRPVQ